MEIDKKEIIEKIELFVLGELDKNEHKVVLDCISENNEFRNYYNQLKAIIKSDEYYRVGNKFSKENSWVRLNKKILLSNDKNKTNYKLLFRIAAGLLVLLAFSFSYFLIVQDDNKQTDLTQELYTVEVPLGTKSKIILPDNTKVILNAGSRIQYPANYNTAEKREIMLSGEAFFDVTENKGAPFIVKAKNIFIEALGTSFNVKAYQGEEKVEATLVEGIIQISKEGESGTITLKPNQKASIFSSVDKANIENVINSNQEDTKPLVKVNKLRNNDVFVQKGINTDLSTSWKDKEWVIKKMKLYDLTILLERRYNIKFKFESEDIKDFQFSGTLTDQPLELILEAVQLGAPIKYKIKTGKVIIDQDERIKKDFQRFLRKD